MRSWDPSGRSKPRSTGWGCARRSHTSEAGTTRGGLPFRIGHLYTILSNRLYRGEISHKGAIHAGDHAAIVDQALWDRAQAQLASNAAIRRSGKASKEPSLLAGLLFDSRGNRMTPSHAVKSGKRYRYYLSNHLIAGPRRGRETDPGEGIRVPAQEIEGHVVSAIAMFLADPQKVIAELCPDNSAPAAASAALRRAAALGDTLRTGGGEHYETIRDLVARVEIGDDTICIALKRSALAEQLDDPV